MNIQEIKSTITIPIWKKIRLHRLKSLFVFFLICIAYQFNWLLIYENLTANFGPKIIKNKEAKITPKVLATISSHSNPLYVVKSLCKTSIRMPKPTILKQSQKLGNKLLVFSLVNK